MRYVSNTVSDRGAEIGVLRVGTLGVPRQQCVNEKSEQTMQLSLSVTMHPSLVLVGSVASCRDLVSPGTIRDR